MIDYYALALEQYQRETAAAREVIRRAQARLRATIAAGPVVGIDPAYAVAADPTEPNGPELDVERLLGLGVQALLDSPQQGHPGLATEPVAPDDAAPDPRPAADPSLVGDGSPAITQPGSARSGPDQRHRNGRRAPAAVAAPPATSSSGSVGTPTPASLTCSVCDYPAKNANGLAIHIGKTGHVRVPPAPSAARSTPKDKREINELCPKGCGRRFTWEPSLLSHASSCKGTPA